MFLLRERRCGRRSTARRDRPNFARFLHAPRARRSGAATAATAALPRLGVGGILRQTASSAAGAEAAWWVSAGRAAAAASSRAAASSASCAWRNRVLRIAPGKGRCPASVRPGLSLARCRSAARFSDGT